MGRWIGTKKQAPSLVSSEDDRAQGLALRRHGGTTEALRDHLGYVDLCPGRNTVVLRLPAAQEQSSHDGLLGQVSVPPCCNGRSNRPARPSALCRTTASRRACLATSASRLYLSATHRPMQLQLQTPLMAAHASTSATPRLAAPLPSQVRPDRQCGCHRPTIQWKISRHPPRVGDPEITSATMLGGVTPGPERDWFILAYCDPMWSCDSLGVSPTDHITALSEKSFILG